MTTPSTPLYREIKLTQGQVAIVDVDDFEWLNQWKWQADLAKTGRYYARRAAWKNGKQCNVKMHRQILGLEPGDRRIADHIESSATLDNRRSNLRIADYSKNAMNRRRASNNSSGFKGVTWNQFHRKWRAEIQSQGKSTFLGYHKTPQLAHAAYAKAAMDLHGVFGRLS